MTKVSVIDFTRLAAQVITDIVENSMISMINQNEEEDYGWEAYEEQLQFDLDEMLLPDGDKNQLEQAFGFKQCVFDLADEVVHTLIERLEYNGYIVKKEETEVEEKEKVKPMMFPVYLCPVCGEEIYDDENECLTCKSELDWSDQDKFDKIK